MFFGGRPDSGRQQQRTPQNFSRPQQGDYVVPPQGGYEDNPMQSPRGSIPRRMPPQQQQRSSQPTTGRSLALRPVKSPGGNSYAFGNLVAVSPLDFGSSGEDVYLMLNGNFVVTARPIESCRPGEIGLTDPQRTWAGISLAPNETVEVQRYDPFSLGGQAYLGSVDAEVGFAGRKSVDAPYDQEDLAKAFTKTFENQLMSPGQIVLMDVKSVPLRLVIKTVQLVDLSMEKEGEGPTLSEPNARGILTRQTVMNFFKDARTGINLKASLTRPATNAILQPNFKFEDMGIGGLDSEFSTIFRRAFASRLFPPGLVERMGIMHVRGILLHGPPGTGKTLIARQIGKMLNAREPKIINGPEVLNKYVGQSEENIRKLFADAEKEYKEKGDESGLHIIIFDELDAVCKQRGSGATGGTGVGDSVVNQLLSKLDGVDQLNNILLIGMTNRIDMIDDALLRPGRLELHVEISLPDEHGRVQIFNIHTSQLRSNGLLDQDVDINELSRNTKNYSGAEISGLVRAACSFAFSRHTEVGKMAKISSDAGTIHVTRDDFESALGETKPMFGVAEEELERCIDQGMINFSGSIERILEAGREDVAAVRNGTQLVSTILHGPPGSGKTALAAQLALSSGFPFVKFISPKDMIGYTEMAKVQQMEKIFRDADKSPLSIVVVDDLEYLIDYVSIGPRFSNIVLSAMRSLLTKRPPKNRRRLILATTSERTVLESLNLLERIFTHQIAVPNVGSADELRFVIRKTGVMADRDIDRAIDMISDALGGSSSGPVPFGVGIKKVLEALQIAKEAGDPAERLADIVSAASVRSISSAS